MNPKHINIATKVAIGLITWSIAAHWNIHMWLGTKTGYFNGFHFLLPLLGLLGTGCSFLLCLFQSFKALIIAPTWTKVLLAAHLPSLCAMLCMSWTRQHKHTSIPHRIILSSILLLCIVLFIAHPQGTSAWIYTSYWLIPLVILWLPIQNFFLQALASTFMAHAVGSVLWLYCFSLPSSLWLHLISIVWLERLLFATAASLLFYTGTLLHYGLIYFLPKIMAIIPHHIFKKMNASK